MCRKVPGDEFLARERQGKDKRRNLPARWRPLCRFDYKMMPAGKILLLDIEG